MTDNELFTKALIFAAKKHAGQCRQNGTPYIWHPIGVAKLVADAGYGIPYQIAALLHDTLEDTDATLEEISEFGSDVLRAVQLLTKCKGVNIKEYVEEVSTFQMAAVVKNFDIIYNCNDAMNADAEWAARYLKKSKDSYYGKFSSSADNAIKTNLALAEALAMEKRAQQPISSENVPDLSRDDIRFYYDELARYYFCFYDTADECNHIWVLTKNGWKFQNENPMFESQYSDDYDEVDIKTIRNKMSEFGIEG